jgi:origin recognition complex subunit 3
MVGSATLDFLADFFCRNSASVEGVLLILQLAHLKHFDEPLTTFVRDEQLDMLSKKLSDPKAAAFVASLFSWSFGPQKLTSNEEGWPVNDVDDLLASIAEARTDFRSHLRLLKFAFGMMRKVHEVVLDLGYRVTGTEMTSLEMMSASLKGGLAREGKHLGTITRSVARYIPNPNKLFLNFHAGAQQETVGRKALDIARGTGLFPRRAPISPG